MARLPYEKRDLAACVRFYTSPGLGPAPRLGDEEYARARAVIPTWCLDGLPCGHTEDGRPVVVLVVRAGEQPTDGPFRHEPWVVGGKWDLVTPWEEFVRVKAVAELFGGCYDSPLSIDGPIGNQLFGAGWGPNTDGPFGCQGVTLQFCYRVLLSEPVRDGMFRPDRNHSRYVVLHAGQPLDDLHPYIRDVIELSGWLV